MAEQLTDQALVERVQQGDKKAFNLLVTIFLMWCKNPL